ncbi:MAG: TRAP transporter fused permease subunit [Deltaproteobacteria bacterium]|nr:TRAP transporter fused permease subunit [Deltaproteobacteria bacterium]
MPEEEKRLSRHRTLKGFIRWMVIIASLIPLTVAVIHNFQISFFGVILGGNSYLYLLLMFYIPLVFLSFPYKKMGRMDEVPWYDFLLAILAFLSGLYFFIHSMDILSMGWEVEAPMPARISSFILLLLILEASRRTTGLIFTCVCLFFGSYPLFSQHMPGFLMGNAFSFWRTVSFHAMGDASIVGLPMTVVGNVLIGFMIFAIALQATGAGKFFLEIALAIFGSVRGGAAKVAIVSSALMGSVSGSVIANVLTTGSFTIPAMKKTGYPAYYAGAVEACASTGGVLMPPIMGATAFVMAQMLGVPYIAIIIAAAIPSVLYYIGLFFQVDCFAATHGLRGLPREECPSLKKALKEGWYYIISFAGLLYIALWMWREAQAPWIAIAVLFLLNLFKRESRINLKGFIQFVEDTGKFMAELTAILAAVGMIIGGLMVTGVAHSFAAEVVSFAGGNVTLLLVLGAVTSLILGMGLTITACYIFLALVMAPAVIAAGYHPLAVHLFIMYWGMISFITPPVAMGSFAAASLAGASFFKTGFQAMRLGLAIYFLPFFFVLNPALVCQGTLFEILYAFLTCAVGIALIASALGGYLIKLGNLKGIWIRSSIFSSGFLISMPEWRTDMIGFVLGGVTILIVALKKS